MASAVVCSSRAGGAEKGRLTVRFDRKGLAAIRCGGQDLLAPGGQLRVGRVGFAAGLLLSGVLSGLWSYSASFTIGGLSVIVVVAVTAYPLIRMFKGWTPPVPSE